MKIKETYQMARNNMKGRKKTGRILSAIFFLAMLIYFLVNSVTGSLNNAVEQIMKCPEARMLTFQKMEDENLYEMLKEACKDMEHVEEVNPFTFAIYGDVSGLGDDSKELGVKACIGAYEDYLVKGEMPEENEILLPHYMNMSGTGSYEKGSKYIGKKIKLYITDYVEEVTEFEFTVSGTYDNVYSVMEDNIALVRPEEAVALDEANMGGIEVELQELMEATGDYNENNYGGFEVTYQYSVVVDDRDNLDDVKEELREKINDTGHEMVMVEGGGTSTIFLFIRLIGNGVALLLMAAVIVMLVIMIGNDIRNRRKEMAMYLVQGYTGKNLIQILGMEYVVRFVPILIWSVIVTAVLLFGANLVITNLLPMEYQVMRMSIALGTGCVGVLIVGAVLGVAVHTISGQLKKITLLEEIKSEG